MESNSSARFFLGSNSPSGFYSLYEDFVDPVSDCLNIIKSGPGSGKSTFMKIIASGISDAGLPVEYIHCSGDPDSLDGVYFPTLKTAYVDGTSPHVIEPKYTGSSDNYVSLSGFYDLPPLREKLPQVMELTSAYKGCYDKAFKLISAMASVIETIPRTVDSDAVSVAEKRCRGIISKELRISGKSSCKISRRFISAITCKGPICLFDTVEALADRIYLLDNSLGLAYPVLETIAKAAAERGWDVILCRSPVFPDTTEHIILPELRLAFVSQTAKSPYPGKGFRHLRLDAIPQRELVLSSKAEIRRKSRLANALQDEAILALREAKFYHDRLEEVYNPYIDFSGVVSLAREHLSSLLKQASPSVNT